MVKRIIKSLLVKYNSFSTGHLSILKRMDIAMSRGALSQSLRKLEKDDPGTWEFSSFSQNGEDGIVQYLASNVVQPDHYFIEIGSSDGIENNTAFLAFALKYSGLMIEGDPHKSSLSRACLQRFNWGISFLNAFVSRENINSILDKHTTTKKPDFFSLDIDGNDYYVMQALLQSGYKPKVICVEYNSSYGPDAAITIKYDPDFSYWNAHESHWYYGVSAAGWKKLMAQFNYEFITVDKNGVNMFFIDPAAFKPGFADSIKKVGFRENFAVYNRTKTTWEKQFDVIKHLEYFEI